jgi:tetratricopeptide (TPR) repeat protein
VTNSNDPSRLHASLPEALAHASRLVLTQPQAAIDQAREILVVAPGHPQAVFILGAALRRTDNFDGARSVLRALADAQPGSPQTHYELGLTLSALGERDKAIAALKRAVEIKPGWPDAWRTLADELRATGDAQGADVAYAQHIATSVNEPKLMEAAQALVGDRLAIAERLLRAYLMERPTDVAAIRMLAEIGTRLGRYGDAEALLSRCLDLAPSFIAARHNYAIVLYRQNRAAEALGHINQLLAADPTDPGYRNLKAAALSLVGEYIEAIELYEGVLAEHPKQVKAWLSYGHALKTAGRQADSIAAYRRSIDLSPTYGEAYWSLANLKTFRFAPDDIATMTAALARPDLQEDDRLHLHYALGKALEDAADYPRSFEHYAAGAKIRRGQIDYDAEETTSQLDRSRALFTPAFFADRAGAGFEDPAPIFVVGLPRSGSTLVEQILASHSAVEGTMELPDIVTLARRLGERKRKTDAPAYPDAVTALDRDALRKLGEEYIERTRIQRKLGRRFFIDKMPNNFLHAGLIHLILPNARIVDARRNSMATCFSAFKQHFARGQNFSYDLGELGRYYRDYVELMAHFDGVLPGRVHRVVYEELVDDTEGEVRRLLDYCGLPFEPGCLRFYENDRAVRTASSEQVRKPIFRDGIDQWRHYAAWLGPLENGLGEALASQAKADRQVS